MATLRDISEAIETRLATISGLRVASFPEAGLTPPIAWPSFTGWNPSAMGRQGWVSAQFDVYVFTSGTARSIDGYRRLLEFADWSGSDSIWLALWDGNDQAAGTFNGLADTTLAVDVDNGFRQLGVTEVDAHQMNGGVFECQVHTKGQ